jgi:hypothetical protein
MRLRYALTLPFLAALSAPALAARDLDQVNQLSQAEFRDLSGDLGATVSYKAVLPIAALGAAGFDFGAEVTATRVEHRDAWDRASSGTAPQTVYVPKIHVHKGLPAGIDVGAFYAAVPDPEFNVWGAEVRYAVIDGGAATPAVGLRGTYSVLSGVDQLSLNTKGIELGISKGFPFFTPYAGVGRIWTDAAPRGASGLQRETVADTKLYVGSSFNILLCTLALEADRVGDTLSYSVKLGFHF